MIRPRVRFVATAGAMALLLGGIAASPTSAAVSPQRDLGAVEVSPGTTITLNFASVGDRLEVGNRSTLQAYITPGTGLVKTSGGVVCDSATACLLDNASSGSIPSVVLEVLRTGTIIIQYTGGTTATIYLEAAAPAAPVVQALYTTASGYVVVDWAPYSWGPFTASSGNFEIESRKSGETAWKPGASAPGGSTQVTDTATFELGATYEYRVRAVPAPSEGSPSNWGSTSIVIPNPPLNLVITPGDSSATFTWKKAPGIDSYEVEAYGGSQIVPTATVTCSADPCSHTVTGLTNGTSYIGYVEGIAPTGRQVALSADVPFTPAVPTLPKPSVAISWRGADGTQASLDWAPYNWGSF
ncbi:MAG: fibronectin type III domain-containing protein, partial [Candidatus Nanopelagicales bacterium]